MVCTSLAAAGFTLTHVLYSRGPTHHKHTSALQHSFSSSALNHGQAGQAQPKSQYTFLITTQTDHVQENGKPDILYINYNIQAVPDYHVGICPTDPLEACLLYMLCSCVCGTAVYAVQPMSRRMYIYTCRGRSVS